ncbi:hypothetical protein HYH02_008669 [Chlamydomonas schloesseri]|uniref:Uncharacterized protein n=1 Tax=Chlamydomonas schloesseri TaxID=2026947 RepID=A0A835WDC0_9CHLO|nr:hypothetical protein HYH02_008669 [Chlamydomonas schloesseri]|eukprot:KAG2445201.1 hypothetical protein HYH02_008669 [Chlamydomonas schloesseri]
MGIKLFLVSIGTHARSKDFVEVTGFPAENLFADPNNDLYTALGLVKGVGATFLSVDTPLAIKRRMDTGNTADLMEILPRWQPWLPPKNDQGLQQGGMFLFNGDRTVLTHYDKATSDHADLAALLGVAGQLAADCDNNCELPPPPPSPARRF